MIRIRLAAGLLLALAGSGQAALPAPSAPAATLPAAILVRSVEAGETLSAADFMTEDRPAAQARSALKAEAAAGMEATRRLVAGNFVRMGDVDAPHPVKRGQPVTLTVRNGALTITTAGRALATGDLGQIVRVVALSTNRTLDGIVEGTGAVRVSAP